MADCKAFSLRKKIKANLYSVIQDSRLQFSIVKGYAIMVGFGTESEVEQWGTMEIPYTGSLKAKVEELERKGIRINWVAPTEPAK